LDAIWAPEEQEVALADAPPLHTCYHDLNSVNTLKSYYDHISRGPTVRFTSTSKHSLFVEKQ